MDMDSVARSAVLAGIPLFERLPSSSRDRMASKMGVRDFGAGEPLLRQGDPGDSLIVVVDGGVSVRLRRTDDVITLATVGPGAVLGEMALVTGAPRNADAVATREGRALVLDAAQFHALAEEIPELVDLLTEVVAERLGRAAQDGLGDKVLAGYRVVRPVGRGGTAVVYEAERLAGGQRVALKMMSHLFARDARALARFDHEAELLARFQHDSITRFHGRFAAYGTVFLVIDYVDGTSLGDIVEVAGTLPAGEARRAFGTIVAAMAHVHRGGVVHGDLKPANVLVDTAGALRLTDFGIAQRIREPGSAPGEPGVIVGTPHYMAPEQFVGAPVSAATDLYALGCLLVELLTGNPPIDADSVGALIWKKRSFDPAVYLRHAPFTDEHVRAAVRGLLARDPAARTLDVERWSAEAGTLPPSRVAAVRDAGPRTGEVLRSPTTLGT